MSDTNMDIHTITRNTTRRVAQRVVTTTILIVSLLGLFLGAGNILPTRSSTQAAPQKAQAPAADPVQFGLHSGFEYVDLVKQSARFDKYPGAPADLARDANGWPLADFQFIFGDDRRNMPWNGPDFNGVPPDVSGTYRLSFTGQATLGTLGLEDPDSLEFQNIAYNSATNTTTADVVVKPNHWLLAIAFGETKRNPGDAPGTGITNVKLIRPGYPANTTQLFTDRYLNALKQLAPRTFRSFDNGINSYGIWNGENMVTVKWADRSLPSDAYWPLPSKNEGDKRGLGVPWEHYIMVANEINSDLWINLPVGADDDYMLQLANLIKNGNSVTPGLEPGLNLYVEYSNEVWNWSFSQAIYNNNLAQQEGISHLQRYVKRTFQISDLFRQTYGNEAMGTSVRTIVVWQYTHQLDIQSTLLWAQQQFGNPAKHYVWGIGEAPYLDPMEHSQAPYPDPADPQAVDRVFDTFYTAAGNRRRAFTQWQTVATYFGLHQVGYEAGPSLGAGLGGDVSRSPRMVDLIQRYFMNDYFATGAEAVNMFALGPGSPAPWGNWYLFEDYNKLDHPKFQGSVAIAGQAKPEIVVGSVLPWSVNNAVTIDASQHVVGTWTSLNKPGSTAATCAGGCWPNPGDLDYLLRVPANGTYSIQLRGQSDNAAAQLRVQIDNQELGVVSLPQGTEGNSGTVSVTLTPGLHTLILSGAGTGKSTFAPNGGITITLTNGGGPAIKPSAPLNLISTVNDGQATLQWDPVTTATSYTIKRSTQSGGAYTTVGTSTTNSFTQTGLSNDTIYYYVVTASNSAGESVISPQVVAEPTQATAPGKPSNVNGSAGGSDPTFTTSGGQVRITWPDVPNATSYKVKRSTSNTGPFETVATQANTFYYDASLTNGTTYYYVVSATNSFGESPDSDVLSLTPQISVPATPTQLTATGGNGQVALKWMQSQWQYPTFGSLFHVKRGTSASGPFTTIINVSTNNIVDVGLNNGQEYCYVISAVNSAGASTDSAPQCTTPTGSGTGWTKCSDEYATCTFSGTMVVRYGADGQFAYTTATDSVNCSNSVFGDPIVGATKACYTAPVPTNGWTKCSDEGGTCNVSGTVTVAYGANSSFAYKTATNSIPCNNSTFGDPAFGTFKGCYYR